jgi:hypothetical protein
MGDESRVVVTIGDTILLQCVELGDRGYMCSDHPFDTRVKLMKTVTDRQTPVRPELCNFTLSPQQQYSGKRKYMDYLEVRTAATADLANVCAFGGESISRTKRASPLPASHAANSSQRRRFAHFLQEINYRENGDSAAVQTELRRLRENMLSEGKVNAEMEKAQRGNPIKYGQLVQLRHTVKGG